MMLPRFLCSPLAGTAAVLAGLAIIAVPLHRLTSSVPLVRPVPETHPSEMTHAIIRVRLLDATDKLLIKTTGGLTVLELSQAPAGESEHDVMLPLDGNGFDAALSAVFSEATRETAVFITLMPDGRESQTRYAIGKGSIAETLPFDWPVN